MAARTYLIQIYPRQRPVPGFAYGLPACGGNPLGQRTGDLSRCATGKFSTLSDQPRAVGVLRADRLTLAGGCGDNHLPGLRVQQLDL